MSLANTLLKGKNTPYISSVNKNALLYLLETKQVQPNTIHTIDGVSAAIQKLKNQNFVQYTIALIYSYSPFTQVDNETSNQDKLYNFVKRSDLWILLTLDSFSNICVDIRVRQGCWATYSRRCRTEVRMIYDIIIAYLRNKNISKPIANGIDYIFSDDEDENVNENENENEDEYEDEYEEEEEKDDSIGIVLKPEAEVYIKFLRDSEDSEYIEYWDDWVEKKEYTKLINRNNIFPSSAFCNVQWEYVDIESTGEIELTGYIPSISYEGEKYIVNKYAFALINPSDIKSMCLNGIINENVKNTVDFLSKYDQSMIGNDINVSKDGWLLIKTKYGDQIAIPRDSPIDVVDKYIQKYDEENEIEEEEEEQQNDVEELVCDKKTNTIYRIYTNQTIIFPQVKKIDILIDLVFGGVFALYDFTEGVVNVTKVLIPAVQESLEEGEGGLGDKLRGIFGRSEITVKRKWKKKFKNLTPEEAQKEIVEEMIERGEKLRNNPKKIVKQLQELNVDQLKILGKDILLDLMSFNGLLSSQQKNAIFFNGFISRNELREYLNNVDIQDKESPFGKLADSISTLYEKREVQVDNEQNIGVCGTGACIAGVAVAVGIAGIIGLGSITGGALTASTPLGAYVLRSFKEGEGGWGDRARRGFRGLQSAIKRQYLKRIRGKTDEEILEIAIEDLKEEVAELSPIELQKRIQSLSVSELQQYPNEIIENLIKNNLLSLDQVKLLKAINVFEINGIDENIIVGTIYDPNYLFYLQELNKEQLKALDLTIIESYLRSGVLTEPQVKYLIDEDIVKKRSLRGTQYNYKKIKKSDEELEDKEPAKFNAGQEDQSSLINSSIQLDSDIRTHFADVTVYTSKRTIKKYPIFHVCYPKYKLCGSLKNEYYYLRK